MDQDDNQATIVRRGPGRPQSIPQAYYETILQRYRQGDGYRRLATYLQGLGVSTSHTAVRRLIKGEGAYSRPISRGTDTLEIKDRQKTLAELMADQLYSGDRKAG